MPGTTISDLLEPTGPRELGLLPIRGADAMTSVRHSGLEVVRERRSTVRAAQRRLQEAMMTMMSTLAGGTLTGTWRIDPAHSSANFSVRHLMSKVRGRFREVDGQILIGPSLRDCRASAAIRADSVDTGVPPRDADLRSNTFLDAENHKDLTFTGSAVEEDADGLLTIVGDLTIRGTTREVRLQAEFLGLDQTGLQGEPRIGLAARTTIRRSDFGVGERAIEGSKLVVGDTVTIELDVEAALEEDEAS